MYKKTILTMMTLVSMGFALPTWAQTGVTQQTIKTEPDGSTTITTIINPHQHSHTPTSNRDANKPPVTQTMTPTYAPKPANQSPAYVTNPAPPPNPPADKVETTHFHFGSLQPQKTSVTPSLNQPTPPVRYENARQDPGDVMMQILNQRPVD